MTVQKILELSRKSLNFLRVPLKSTGPFRTFYDLLEPYWLSEAADKRVPIRTFNATEAQRRVSGVKPESHKPDGESCPKCSDAIVVRSRNT